MTVTTAPGAVADPVVRARAAQSVWAGATLRERSALLRRLSAVVLARADEIADVVVAETGKPRVEAYTTELYPALDSAAWLAKNVERVLAPERVRYPQPHLRH